MRTTTEGKREGESRILQRQTRHKCISEIKLPLRNAFPTTSKECNTFTHIQHTTASSPKVPVRYTHNDSQDPHSSHKHTNIRQFFHENTYYARRAKFQEVVSALCYCYCIASMHFAPVKSKFYCNERGSMVSLGWIQSRDGLSMNFMPSYKWRSHERARKDEWFFFPCSIIFIFLSLTSNPAVKGLPIRILSMALLMSRVPFSIYFRFPNPKQVSQTCKRRTSNVYADLF